MPLMCLVPLCPTGSRYSRSLNQTHSMFNIPRDESLKRKWEEAIPGDITLKYGQVVCAKHFLKNQIITEFELKDKFGNVIGKHAYKRPRLKENAVPSIFEVPIYVGKDKDSSNEEHSYSIDCSQSLTISRLKGIDTKIQEDNFSKFRNALDNNIVQNSVFDIDLLKIISKKYSRESVNKRKQNVIHDNDLLNVTSKRNSNVLDIKSLTNDSNSNKLSIASYSICSNIDYENDKNTPKQKNEHNSLQVHYRSIISINNKEMEIPKSWSIIQKNINSQFTLIFVHSVSIIVNESENKDKIKKYIIFNCSNRQARYFAHGREVVGVYKDHLLPQLNSAELLVATLLKFEKMRMCEGLKREYMPLAIVGEYYMDKFNTWRTKQCTLLTSKYDKCKYCNELTRKLFERRTCWIHRAQTSSKFHTSAFLLNTDFKDRGDFNKTFEKNFGTSIEDEYMQEIDSLEFPNDKETVIKKINVSSDIKKANVF